MDAVIFNGSGNRNAISRASVELFFDNSLGGASNNSASEWSQYAEIAVKRVIERDKGSSYYINNTLVRRRDVADLFLGTGLGGRAYAIIGQNTITRIVEAKPEELRIFLEEAAGISKYKERRRETELRLRDTRENLTRIEDIRRELGAQITKLGSQALIAEQYHRLQAALKHAQGQLWLLKKRGASTSWEKSKRQVEKLVNELEAQMAALRKTETVLESLRQQHYASTEAVQTAQTRYYEANAAVSSLEQQAKNTAEARERISAQLLQQAVQTQKIESLGLELQESLQQLITQQQEVDTSGTVAEQALNAVRLNFPKSEQGYAATLQADIDAQKTLTDTVQGMQLETANLDHLSRAMNEIGQRLEHLEREQARLQLPDLAELSQKQAAYEKAQKGIVKLGQEISQLLEQEQQQAEQIKQLREVQMLEERGLTEIKAHVASLSKIQESLGHEAKLDGWLKNAGLQDSERLWQKIGIESGWETALEAVLGARLNAIFRNKLPADTALKQRPPAALVFCQPGEGGKKTVEPHSQWKPLTSVVSNMDSGLAALMQDWLAGVYVLGDAENAEKARKQLKAGEMLVSRLGDVYTPNSVALYAAQSALHGVLERQRELADLQAQLPQLQNKLNAHNKALSQAEIALQQLKQAYQGQQQALLSETQSQHNLNLEIQRLQQQHQHATEQKKTMQAEQQALQQRLTELQADQKQKQEGLESAQVLLTALQTGCNEAQAAKQVAETALNALRSELQQAERLAQEKVFNKKIIINNINEINNRINALSEEKQALAVRRVEAETMLEAAKTGGLKANLETALVGLQQAETALAEARNAMASIEQELQNQERTRMQDEQYLHPLRDKLEQARLGEQEARLYFEQCQQELASTGLDEALLAEGLAASTKMGDIEQSIQALDEQINELGAVNLAAIQELASESERKAYLDSQTLDLEQAIATLEDAIRRIDKETRGRLQQTFEEVNRHFAELFSVLFGGGQARLELLGEEILDTGMQVFAQPPGKRNSTIHLLSGGEKALTALALVFALFRLNPAPFCLMDEVDAPLDDSNVERFCNMVKKMSELTQFLFVTHNKITMEMAQQLIGVTMQESGVSRIVEVDIEAALKMNGEMNNEATV